MGEGRPEATWTVHGSSEGPSWKLLVAGEKGEISLTAEEKAPDWNVRTERVSLPSRTDMTAFDEGERVLQSLTEGTREASYAADWNDLIRAFEIVDAARASARRRRAIDLHLETTSERNIFKSHMTAVGCLLLTFTLVGVVFLLLVMPLFDGRSRTQLEAQRADAIIRVTDFARDGNSEREGDGSRAADRLPHGGGPLSGAHRGNQRRGRPPAQRAPP